ncbi:MAG: TolC family protein [Nitrospirota bacterium]
MVLVSAFLFPVLLFPARGGAAEKLTLRECIEIALKEHPGIRSSAGVLDAAAGRVTQSASPYYPHVQASTGYSENHSTGGAFGDTVQKGYATTLSVNQLLYDFGRTGNAYDAAKAGFHASERDRDRVAQEIILDVKQAFFALLQAEKLLNVANKTLEQSESHLQQAQAFFRSGSRPKYEVTRAEVEVNNSRLGVITAKNNLRISAIGLNKTMGREPGIAVEVQETTAATSIPLPLSEIEAEALKSRPEMLKAEADVETASARVRAERSGYYPNITANGSYTWAQGTAESGMFKGDLGNSWAAGVTLNLPLFEGGLTRGRVGEARANLLVAEAQRDSLKQAILLSVNQAYADYEGATLRVEVMESSLRKAQENLDIAQGRYQAGVGPYIEVTDAQVASIKAETDHVQAQYDLLLAVARLEMAMGRISAE